MFKLISLFLMVLVVTYAFEVHAGIFGPTDATECAQKYFPKIKLAGAKHLITMSCGTWFVDRELDSDVRSTGKCIAKNTSDIYSVESGLKVINNCSNGNVQVYKLFSSYLLDQIADVGNQQIRNQVRREINSTSQKSVTIYDAKSGTYKNCSQNGSSMVCY